METRNYYKREVGGVFISKLVYKIFFIGIYKDEFKVNEIKMSKYKVCKTTF